MESSRAPQKLKKEMWRKLIQLKSVLRLVIRERNVFFGSSPKKQRIAKFLYSEVRLKDFYFSILCMFNTFYNFLTHNLEIANFSTFF